MVNDVPRRLLVLLRAGGRLGAGDGRQLPCTHMDMARTWVMAHAMLRACMRPGRPQLDLWIKRVEEGVSESREGGLTLNT